MAIVALSTCLAVASFATDSVALPGTHGPAVSTWDTTLSTVMFAFHGGLFDGGHLHMGSYVSNFTSTTGKLSAQFGLHYLNYQGDPDSDIIHGLGATAMAVYGIPVGDRYDNGLPKAAFTFFLGGAPSALLSNQNNLFTFAIPIGIGLPFSPSKYISLVPWVEVAPSFNVDTKILPFDATQEEIDGWVDPTTGDMNLTEEQVAEILAGSVKTEMSFAARLRGGLSMVFHLGNKVDLQLNGTVSHIGSEFNGPVSVFFGGGLVFAWDDPPPTVLPPKEEPVPRETKGQTPVDPATIPEPTRETCKEIYDRFTRCPFYPKLIKKARSQGYQKCLKNNDCKKKPAAPTTPVKPQPKTGPPRPGQPVVK